MLSAVSLPISIEFPGLLGGDGQELDGQVEQFQWTVRAFAIEQERVAWLHGVLVGAVAVHHLSGEHVDEFGTGVLEQREHVAGVREGHQSGFQGIAPALESAQDAVFVAVLRATTDGEAALPAFGEGGVPVGVRATEQRSDRDFQPVGQPLQGGQRTGGGGRLNSGDHPLGHTGARRQFCGRQALSGAVVPYLCRDDLFQATGHLSGTVLFWKILGVSVCSVSSGPFGHMSHLRGRMGRCSEGRMLERFTLPEP